MNRFKRTVLAMAKNAPASSERKFCAQISRELDLSCMCLFQLLCKLGKLPNRTEKLAHSSGKKYSESNFHLIASSPRRARIANLGGANHEKLASSNYLFRGCCCLRGGVRLSCCKRGENTLLGCRKTFSKDSNKKTPKFE